MPAAKPPKPTVLLQLDVDPQPSVFDALVAIDAGVDHLLRQGNVDRHDVPGLVHGLLFTRGGDDLRRSAVFVGGNDFAGANAVATAVADAFFGPFRVSVFCDAKGSNTTAAALALAVERSLGEPSSWSDRSVVILGYGPVGRQAAGLLAMLGARVRVFSPEFVEALAIFEEGLTFRVEGRGSIELIPYPTESGWQAQGDQAQVLIAAGPPGVEVLPTIGRELFPDLRVAVDLNAVPPHGIGTVKPTDADEDREGVRTWGALGVGGLKMKVHKAVIRRLFDAEAMVYGVREVYEVGREVLGSK